MIIRSTALDDLIAISNIELQRYSIEETASEEEYKILAFINGPLINEKRWYLSGDSWYQYSFNHQYKGYELVITDTKAQG